MTARPCSISICCAYAAPESEYCPAHAHFLAEGLLDVYTGTVSRRRPGRSHRRRSADEPNAEAWLPLPDDQPHRTE